MKLLFFALVSAYGLVLAQAQPPVQSLLTVRIQGNGTVSPKLGGRTLTVGETYVIQAIPLGGDVFANWTGSISSTANPLSFVMQANTVLQANFAANPFPPVAGVYEGLFMNPTNADMENSGFLRVVVGHSGAFSGLVTQGSRPTSFSGQFVAAGSASSLVGNSASEALTLSLQLDFTGTNTLTGTVGNGQWSSTLAAWRGGRYRTSSKTAYTLIVPGAPDATTAPGGAGFAELSVDTVGHGTLSGILADNTPVTASAQVSSAAAWPFYASLYAGQGAILGWLSLTNGTGNGLNGTCIWIKKRQPTTYYPAGFTNRLQVSGSRYVITNNSPVLGLTNAFMYLGAGNLTNAATNTVSVVGSAVTSTNRSLKLSFAPGSGRFSGSVANPAVPAAPKSLKLKGTVLQNQNVALGFFLSGSQSGLVGIGGQPAAVIQGGDSSFNQYSYRASTAPGDPLILQATRSDGTVVSYLGPKTTTGVPLAVNSFIVQDPSGNATSISLDPQGRPSLVTAPNGVVFDYVWLSSTVVEISAFMPDGLSVSVTNDLATPNPNGVSPRLENRGSRSKTETIAGPAGHHPAYAPAPPPSATPELGTQATITLTSCGQPVAADQAQVWLNIFFDDPLAPFTRPATAAGNGQWTVYVGGPAGSANLEDICSSIAGVLGAGCSALEGLPEGGEVLPCAALGAAATAIATPAAGAAVYAACEAGVAALRLYCETLGQGIPGGPDLADQLCELLRPVDAWLDNTPMTYVAVGQIQGSPDSPISADFATTTAGPRPQNFTLADTCCQLTIQATGNGAVAAIPPGPAYPAGTLVTLTATPGSGSSFEGWSGAASGTTPTTQITMNGNQSVSAAFSIDPWAGTWSGNYTVTRENQGCAWVDVGSLAMTVSSDGQSFYASVSMDGIQCHNIDDCSLIDVSAASGTLSGTVTANTISASGQITSSTGSCAGQSLTVTFTGTLDSGVLSGTLSAPGNGSLTLTKF